MRYVILLILTTLALANANGQYKDSTNVSAEADTLVLLNVDEAKPIDLSHLARKSSMDKYRSPHKATFYAAIFPGLGQIYNRKYWKLPLVYGGIAALCYSIHFNGKHYNKYRAAYRDFIIRDPNNKSYISIQEKTGLTLEQVEGTYATWFGNALKNKRDYYRRYRDMSYFGMAGVYLVQLVDACVDAHFSDFDVSDDLSMSWTPTFQNYDGIPNMGLSISITF